MYIKNVCRMLFKPITIEQYIVRIRCINWIHYEIASMYTLNMIAKDRSLYYHIGILNCRKKNLFPIILDKKVFNIKSEIFKKFHMYCEHLRYLKWIYSEFSISLWKFVDWIAHANMLKQVNEIIPFLEKSLNATILDITAVPLTAQGDNYGSTILAVSVKVKFNVRNEIFLNEVWPFYIHHFFKSVFFVHVVVVVIIAICKNRFVDANYPIGC